MLGMAIINSHCCFHKEIKADLNEQLYQKNFKSFKFYSLCRITSTFNNTVHALGTGTDRPGEFHTWPLAVGPCCCNACTVCFCAAKVVKASPDKDVKFKISLIRPYLTFYLTCHHK